jgi:hypothetical protein
MELNIERLQELVIQFKVLESKDFMTYEELKEYNRLKDEIMTLLKGTF